MGCLFGYCGHYDENLLNNMASVLSHRYSRGWEKVSLRIAQDYVIEIGHGITEWSTDKCVVQQSEKKMACAYAGVLFNAHDSVSFGRSDKEINYNSSLTYIMPGLEKNPEQVLTSLNGAFVMAFARERDLYLVRDAAGVKALYWAKNKERLVFASEIKALFADPALPRYMREGAVSEYLTFSFIPGQRTMFQGIEELQPGCILRYSQEKVSLNRYFIFENKEFPDSYMRSNELSIKAVRTALEKSVSECCRVVEDPPAVFLSGGIDSSAVLAVAARLFPGRSLKTFSLHFGYKYANENKFISLMVKKYQTQHTWLEIHPRDFLERMNRIIWYLDDPIGDPVSVPNFLLAEKASKTTDVVLNGEGGDPCFGGPKNIPMILSHLYGPFADGVSRSWLEHNYLMSYRRCYNYLKDLLDPVLYRASGGIEALTSFMSPFFNADIPRSFLNKLMTINIRLKGANLILVKVDKMTSANGILALAPLFSRRIIETSMACPPGLKLHGNIEKYILKEAVKDIVPYEIIQRPKSGMMVPVKFWLKGEMRRYAKKVLSKKNLKRTGIFNPSFVQKLIDYEMTEVHSFRYGLMLWMLITFMLWYEQMIESHPIEVKW